MAVLTEELNPICIGIDVGQISDPTAIAVAEVFQVDTGKVRYGSEQTIGHVDDRGNWIPPTGVDPVMVSEYTIRHIRRLPLGTSYPDVANHIADMLCSPLFVGRRVRVLIDVTGVGRPVYDDLKKEIDIRKYGLWAREKSGEWTRNDAHPSAKKINAQLKPMSFVHGERYNRSTGALGKAYLVSRLQSLLQSGRVHGPDTPEMKATIEELRVYEIKVSQDGKDTYGASVGKHDDLATALGLSCLEDPYSERVTYSNRVY